MEDDKLETIDVEMSDEDFLTIAKMAHEKDITFNQMVVLILEEHVIKKGKDVYLDRIGAEDGETTGRDSD